MKDCTHCGIKKPLTEFYSRLDKEARCKPCVSKLRKEAYARDPQKVLTRVTKYRNGNPEKIRDTKLRQAYGVGVDYYKARLLEQGGTCAGCKRHVETRRQDRVINMALDHCHRTGQPRGVLCIKCNRALGLLEESLSTLANLAKYINKYQK